MFDYYFSLIKNIYNSLVNYFLFFTSLSINIWYLILGNLLFSKINHPFFCHKKKMK